MKVLLPTALGVVVQVALLPHGGMVESPDTLQRGNNGECSRYHACNNKYSEAVCTHFCGRPSECTTKAHRLKQAAQGALRTDVDVIFLSTPHFTAANQADSPLGNPTSGGYSYRNVPVLYPGGETLAGGEAGNSITRSTFSWHKTHELALGCQLDLLPLSHMQNGMLKWAESVPLGFAPDVPIIAEDWGRAARLQKRLEKIAEDLLAVNQDAVRTEEERRGRKKALEGVVQRELGCSDDDCEELFGGEPPGEEAFEGVVQREACPDDDC